ncbi:MAG: SH3 domain-containing protein [Methyloceanibacter sp.]
MPLPPRRPAQTADDDVHANRIKPLAFVNLREGPSPSAPVISVVAKGAKLRVIGRKQRWVQVTNPAIRRAVGSTRAMGPPCADRRADIHGREGRLRGGPGSSMPAQCKTSGDGRDNDDDTHDWPPCTLLSLLANLVRREAFSTNHILLLRARCSCVVFNAAPRKLCGHPLHATLGSESATCPTLLSASGTKRTPTRASILVIL